MVSATQWQQDTQLLPTNPYQRLRYYPAFPGGMRVFGWHPVPLTIKPVGSPSGFMSTGGISGVRGLRGLGLLPDATSILKGAVALTGVVLGVWLAHKNLTEP